MKKGLKLTILKAFWRSMRPAVVVYLVALLSFGLVAFLTRFSSSFFWYSSSVFTAINLAYFTYQAIGYYRHYQSLESLDVSQRAEWEALAKGHDPIESVYQAKLLELADLYYRDMQANREVQQEQLDYFTLWLHQIKTPIAAMSLLNQGMTDAQQKRQFQQELIRVEDYTHMALSYLKLSEHSQELDLGVVDVDLVVKKVIKKYAVLFIYNQVQLDYQPLNLKVVSDGKWLEVLIELIISNSLKYAPQGKIRIYKEGQTLVFWDNGMGISSQDLPKIFEKGYSGTNGRLTEKSTGLGLFLSKRICQRLGHSITVESELGDYTRVSVTLDQENLSLYD